MAILSTNLGLVSMSKRISELAPLAMVGDVGDEAACVFRDGCFGPDSPIGLRPQGITSAMLPIGWFMAAAVTLAAVGVRSPATRGHQPIVVVLTGALAIGIIRSVGSIRLPRRRGLTRQNLTPMLNPEGDSADGSVGTVVDG